MKMIDETLQELWSVKDNLAKEHAYDLDSLVDYLKKKYNLERETIQTPVLSSIESKFEIT
jgi:hypothetical protein